jgi:hypothetical protein
MALDGIEGVIEGAVRRLACSVYTVKENRDALCHRGSVLSWQALPRGILAGI